MTKPDRLTRQGVRDLGGNRPIVPTCSHQAWKTETRMILAWSSAWGEYETHANVRICRICGKPLEGYRR